MNIVKSQASGLFGGRIADRIKRNIQQRLIKTLLIEHVQGVGASNDEAGKICRLAFAFLSLRFPVPETQLLHAPMSAIFRRSCLLQALVG